MNTPSSIGKVIRDIVELMELQFQLFSIDAQKAKLAFRRAVIFAVAAAVLLTPAITTLFIGLGFLVGELTSWSIGLSLLVVGAVATIVMGLLAVIGLATLGRVSDAMNESKSELVENMKWIKATVLAPSTSPRNQIRSESFDFPPYQSSPLPSDHRWQTSAGVTHSNPLR